MSTVIVPAGVLLPESVVQSEPFAVLTAFVAINTLAYVALAVAKTLPKVYPGDWIGSRARRAESRSIYPDAPADPAPEHHQD